MMELNDIKNLWKAETVDAPEISVEKQKEIHMPLEKIRYNMRMEFWMSILMYPLMLLGLFPIYKNYDPQQLFLLGVWFVVMIFVVVYYFLKFHSLYKKLSTQSFKTFHNLLNLRYELVLNTEHYKSYYLAFLPIIFGMYIVMFSWTKPSAVAPFMFVVSFLVGCTVLFIMGRVWLKEVYGKYIVQISDLVTTLTNDRDDFEFNRNALMSDSQYFVFISKTENWFVDKLGLNGKLINAIFWTIVGLLLLFVMGVLLGYGIGYFAKEFEGVDFWT